MLQTRVYRNETKKALLTAHAYNGAAIRERAGEAYAANQNISRKSGIGVFAVITK